jgi:lysophospholipase L1-like esterase
MGTKKTWALVGAGISSVGVGIAAWARVRRAQERFAQHKTRLNETLPVHSQWWRDLATTEGDLLYVALGDSAAQGIGASAPKNSYVGVIADHVATTTGRSVQVVNLSVSGATVALAVADQLPRFAAYSPDLVTVAIGANDIAAFDPELFETGIRKVFGALPYNAVVADLPYFFFPWNEKKVAVANRILREVAEERGLTVVPLHESMRRQGLKGIFTQFAEDLFHPNDHGYRVWASAFLPAVTSLVAGRFPRQPAQPAVVEGEPDAAGGHPDPAALV